MPQLLPHAAWISRGGNGLGGELDQVRGIHLKLPGQGSGIKAALVADGIHLAENGLVARAVHNGPQALAGGGARSENRQDAGVGMGVDHN